MGKAQRDKGANGEREVVAMLRAHGFPCHRTPNSGGLFIPGDIVGMPRLHLEVKRQERLSLPAWCAQAEAEAPEDTTPMVVYRSSRQPWRAVVDFDWLLGVIENGY